MKIALLTVATTLPYRDYARNLRKSALRFFSQADFILFSDHESNPGVEKWFYTEPKGHPLETLYRYHTILKKKEELSEYDQVFWVDADMEFVAPPGDIFSDGITATLHPGYVGQKGTPELRPQSSAYCPDAEQYFCGGFIGGFQPAFLHMASFIRDGVDKDRDNDIVAIWHDESHEQKYLALFPPKKILSPSYCYPENYSGQYNWPEAYEPILLCLTKPKSVRGDR